MKKVRSRATRELDYETGTHSIMEPKEESVLSRTEL